MITALLILILALQIIALVGIRRTREDIWSAKEELKLEYRLSGARARQQRRAVQTVTGGTKPIVDATPRTTRRDTDDLPRTGRQRAGLRFEAKGGSLERPNHDGGLQ